jgi:hypothetical protein
LRCWLLELIGGVRSTEALPTLREALVSPNESIRCCARRALQQLDTKEARTLLWRDQQQHAL